MTLSRFAAFAALSLSFAASASPQATAQTIVIYSFGFQPHPIRLVAGRPVTLTFVNQSGSGHDFTAKTFFGNSRILSGDAAEGEVELQPHQTKSVTLVPRTGTYKAHCSHFLHAQMGMTDSIVVS